MKYGATITPYSTAYSPGTSHFVVDTKAGLITAFSNGKAGQLIYVVDTAQIDLSGQADLAFAANVVSHGGMIFTDTLTYSWDQLLRPKSNVTFSGIRLRGPDGNVGTSDQKPMVSGIWCSGYSGLIVENCEIYQWTFAGVAALSVGAYHVHHNNVHHNQRLGEGYGFFHFGSTGVLEENTFDYGRHFAAAERGTPAPNITARNNIFGSHCTHTCFDFHGGTDINDASVCAGGNSKVYNNTFLSTTQPSVKPRGIPETMLEIYQNWTYQSKQSSAFQQELLEMKDGTLTRVIVGSNYKNMSVHDNWYGTTKPPNRKAILSVEVKNGVH